MAAENDLAQRKARFDVAYLDGKDAMHGQDHVEDLEEASPKSNLGFGGSEPWNSLKT